MSECVMAREHGLHSCFYINAIVNMGDTIDKDVFQGAFIQLIFQLMIFLWT